MEVRKGSHGGRDFSFACLPEVHATWWTFEDEKEIREAVWKVGPGDVVFDVGSCFGSYVLTGLAAGASKAWAWNPSQEENDILVASLTANGWSEACVVFPFGVSDADGTTKEIVAAAVEAVAGRTDVKLLPAASRAWVAYLLSGGTREVMEFPVRTLDSFLKEFGSPCKSWMKIDVEGMEASVLRGARQFLEEWKPRVLVECHDFGAGSTEGEVTELMAELGYSVEWSAPYHTVRHVLLVPGPAGASA